MTTQPRLVNKQFNSPIGLYSTDNVQEVLHREQQLLANGAVGIDFYNQQVGKPANLQNSAVLRMLEEEENRRGGRAGNGDNHSKVRDIWPPSDSDHANRLRSSFKDVVTPGVKRVAWPPPQEGVLDPAELTEHNAVQSQGGPRYSNQTPGLLQNNYSPQQATPYQQPSQPSYRPLKPLDISSVGTGSPLASPALNQSPSGYRSATPSKGWAPVHSPVTTPLGPSSQKYFGAPEQGYQSQPQQQAVSQPYQHPGQAYQESGKQFIQPARQQQPVKQSQGYQEPGRQYGPVKHNQAPSPSYQQPGQYGQQYQQPGNYNQAAPQSYEDPSRQYSQPVQQYQPSGQQYQQSNQYQQPNQYQQSNQYQQAPQQYQPPPQQYQQPPQQYQQPPQQYQQPPQQYQQPSQQYQQPPKQYQPLTPQNQSPQPQQYQSQSFAQPASNQNQAPFQPAAAQAQAAPKPQPAKQVEPPPSTITLRPSAPVSQAPAPVYSTQPATATLKGGKHLRGDLKWPPENVRQRMAEEKQQLEELEKGPANRPHKREKDYSRFFAEHALNDAYPGYKIPPGTQFYRPE